MFKQLGSMAGPVVAFLVAVMLFLLAIGLCGVGANTQFRNQNLASAGIFCFALSALSFVVAVLWTIVVAIVAVVRRSRGRQNS